MNPRKRRSEFRLLPKQLLQWIDRVNNCSNNRRFAKPAFCCIQNAGLFISETRPFARCDRADRTPQTRFQADHRLGGAA